MRSRSSRWETLRISRRELRDRIGYVPQKGVLFSEMCIRDSFKRFLLQVRENLLESDDKNRSLSQEKAPDEKILF